MKSSLIVSLAIVPFFAVSSLQAQKEVTNADLLRKLEEIEGKLESLDKRVASIEAKANVPGAATTVALPQAKEDRESFLKRLRAELSSSAARASGPWSDPNPGKTLRKGLPRPKCAVFWGDPTSKNCPSILASPTFGYTKATSMPTEKRNAASSISRMAGSIRSKNHKADQRFWR